jgi:hypothetical protein
MATIRFTYLFDDNGFRTALLPVIAEAENGNYQLLHELAEQTMRSKPELWTFLEAWFLGQPFAEVGETSSPRRLLMMVMADYLESIHEVDHFKVWEPIPKILRVIGWNEEEVNLLQFGKPFCQLLLPEKTIT